jgi:hypothetical protein
VKHAGPDALQRLAPLLAQLRGVEGLVEKSTGTFYRKSRAFVHFHEDPTGLYADVRLEADGDFTRLRVTTAAEQKRLMREVRTTLH